jgi:sortase (surface protein transpeptidase)
MQVKKYNISKPKKYMKGTEEKTQWNTIGTLTEFTKEDGTVSRILEIPAIGLEANVFEKEEKADGEKW